MADRRSALPLCPLFNPHDFRIEPCLFLHCLTATIRRDQIWSIKHVIRLSERDDKKRRAWAYNNRPGMTEWRKRYNAIRRSNPKIVAKMRAAGIDYFHRNKLAVYAYRKEQRRTNPQYRIGCNLRTYIYQKVGKKKPGPESRLIEIVGCTLSQICEHLEKHFQTGMTWDNYGKGDGKWSIDHTKPVALFDLTKLEEQKECFFYKNLRPMWWRENLRKSDRF